jgi:hypothetical protein
MNARKATISADVFKSVLTVTFANGKSLEVDVSKLSPDIQQQAMLHGIKQKLVDAAAIARNPDTGRSASVDDKYAAVAEIHARITSPNGTWNKVREAGATPATKGNLLVRALMKMTGKDKNYVDDFLSSKTKEERNALQRNPRVLQIIAELQANAGTGDVDTDALLGELGAGDSVEPAAETNNETDFERTNIKGEPMPAKPARARKSKKEPVAA